MGPLEVSIAWFSDLRPSDVGGLAGGDQRGLTIDRRPPRCAQTAINRQPMSLARRAPPPAVMGGRQASYGCDERANLFAAARYGSCPVLPMICHLNGTQCTFSEMLGAYISSSTAKEVHSLGMVVGLVDRHLRGLEPTPVQCQTIMADTHCRIRFTEAGKASADIGRTQVRGSSVPV
jgi:hypothetical protein